MDYKEFAEICSERAELYKKQGDVWAQLHEERCATVITELLARAEAAENCIEEINTAILLKSKTEALNAIKRWRVGNED